MTNLRELLALGLGMALLLCSPPFAAAVPTADDKVLVSRARLGVNSAFEIEEFELWPSGRHLLTRGFSGLYGRTSAVLWELSTGRPVRRFVCPAEANTITHAWAQGTGQPHSGAKVAMTCDGVMHLWDVATDRLQAKLRTNESVDDFVVTPDDQWAMTTDAKGSVRVWNMGSGRQVGRFTGHKSRPTRLVLSFDGKTAFTADEYEGTAQLWEASTGKVRRRFKDQGFFISGDGRWLAIPMDGKVGLFDMATARTVGLFTGDTAGQVTTDGTKFLTSDGRNSFLWSVATRALSRTFEGPNGHLSPDGRRVLTLGGDDSIRLWDSATGQEVGSVAGGLTLIPGDAPRFSPDGDRLITHDGKDTVVWDATTGKELSRRVTAMQNVTLDGRHVMAQLDGMAGVRLLDLSTGREVQRFDSHAPIVLSVAFSADGRSVLTGNDGHYAALWNLATGREVMRFVGHDSDVTSVDLSPNGQLVMTGSDDRTVRLWDAATGKQLRRYAFDGELKVAEFSSDGLQMRAQSWDGKKLDAWIWDLATGTKVKRIADEQPVRLKGESGTGKRLPSFESVEALASFPASSPRGDLVVTGGADGSTRLWRTDTGEELAALYSFKDGSSAVIDRQGRFDAPNGGQNAHLYWIVGLETIGLDQLKERYFEPSLLPKKLGLGSEPARDVAALGDVALYPRVEIVQRPTPAAPVLRVRVTNQGGGIGRVVVRVNGKELSDDARPHPAQDANAKELTVQVDMATALAGFDTAGTNRIEVFAYNAAGYLSSRGQVEDYEPAGATAAAPVTLWAVVVGTSRYTDDRINLRYPAKDARDIAKAIEIGARALFGADRVKLRLLTSDGAEAEQPTRANLRAAFDALKQAKPGDIVVAFLAGHGVASKDLYYYPTREASSLVVEDPAVWAQRAVSSADLAQWLKASPALKQVLVLDTCAAGAAAKSMLAVRDAPADQIRALDRMKDRAGVYVLMGAAADRVSYESNEYQQGLLTYALLKGMNGARLREGQYVDIAQLFEYVADQVPLLAKGIGGIQKPYIATPGSTAPGKATASFDIGRLSADDRKQIVLRSPRPMILSPRLLNAELIEDDLKLEPMLRARLRESSYAVARGQPAQVVYVDADEMAGAIQLSGQYTVQAPNLQVRLVLRRGESRANMTVNCARNALDKCAEAMEQEIVKAAAQLP